MDLSANIILFYIVFLVATGYLVPFIEKKRLARAIAWTITVVTVVVSTWATSGRPPLVGMVTIVFLQLLSMKIVVAVEVYAGSNRLNIFQWMAFAAGWFGMRPTLFEKLPAPTLPYAGMVYKGVLAIVAGFILLRLSALAEQFTDQAMYFVSSLLLLIGVSLILHFGILNLSAAAWRRMGVDVSELFRSPYRSRSLTEFWGKRWNVAFSEMTSLIAYRPLKGKLGAGKAVVISFLLSGLLHEIAISLPVRSGYGFPMLYFAIHAAAMQAESTSHFVQKVIAHRIWSRVWVMTCLVLPLPLLFHQQFILNILIPLRNTLLSWWP